MIVNVSLKSQRIDYIEEFSKKVASLDEVVEAYVTGGVFDYILKVVVKDPDSFNDFIATKLSVIPNISNIQSSFVMSYIKESSKLYF